MTELTGRHMEFELFTLSFDEYLGMKGFLGKSIGERRAEFEEYLRYGGFPRALTYDDPEAKATYLEGVVAQVVEKGIKARRSLRGEEKYYLADLGIYYARNTDARINYGPSLENVLYVYLRSHGYRLSVGRIGKLECDFICRKHDKYAYVQVSMSIADRSVEDREYRPFSYIRDNYPQFLFTLDPLLQRRDGVSHLNLADFMADGGELLAP